MADSKYGAEKVKDVPLSSCCAWNKEVFKDRSRDTIKQDEGIPGYIGEYTFTREYSD